MPRASAISPTLCSSSYRTNRIRILVESPKTLNSSARSAISFSSGRLHFLPIFPFLSSRLTGFLCFLPRQAGTSSRKSRKVGVQQLSYPQSMPEQSQTVPALPDPDTGNTSIATLSFCAKTLFRPHSRFFSPFLSFSLAGGCRCSPIFYQNSVPFLLFFCHL